MKPLYEINSDLQALMSQAEAQAAENDGEISAELGDLLDALECDRAEKIGNICRYIKSLDADAKMVKGEVNTLAKRVESVKNKSISLKNYLSTMMGEGEKYADKNSTVSWRKSEGVNIINADIVPDDYCKIERKPIATEIKKAIMSGGNVAGAEIYVKQNIQIK